MNTKTLSAQMQAVLQLLDSESLTVHQLNDRLYEVTSSQSRRAFAASMSRTVRRLEERGLVFRQGETLTITQSGRWALHPEQHQLAIEQSVRSIRQAVAQAVAESPELQEVLVWAAEVNASWEQLKKSKR